VRGTAVSVITGVSVVIETGIVSVATTRVGTTVAVSISGLQATSSRQNKQMKVIGICLMATSKIVNCEQ
jgi:hypothetical protein